MHDPHFAYRPDIDGLRAIAVTAVIVFHAFPDSIPGGFVGVDIFFVISGFLITSILHREISDSTFSITAFYARRVKRLFPALAVVLVATLLIGWAILLEDEYRKLGWHISAGAGFISNIALWSESGYFDGKSELKPLLHLWSLGIEEQFYFVWPLIIAIIFRAKLNFLVVAGGLLLISFGLNVFFVESDPTGTFFLPYFRFWELVLGGMLAAGTLFSNRNWQATSPSPKQLRFLTTLSETSAFLGLALIAFAVIAINPERSFPGWWALFPTMGTVLLIGAGRRTWLARQVMSLKVLIYIGLISYPLYLWHWPLLSFARIVYPELPPLEVRVSLVVATIILAGATYSYVELPFRRLAKKPGYSASAITGLVTVMFVIFLIGLMTYKGIPKVRLHDLSLTLSEARRDSRYPGDAKKRVLEGISGERVFFFGDSYIAQIWPRIKFIVSQTSPHRTVIFHTRSGCTPTPGISRKSDPGCATFSEQGYILAAAPNIEVVVVGGSWLGMLGRGDYFDVNDPDEKIIDFRSEATLSLVFGRFESELEMLKSLGKEVFVVLNPPGGDRADPGIQGADVRLGTGKKPEVKFRTLLEYQQSTGEVHKRLRTIAERLGISVIDPSNWICDEQKCFLTDLDGVPRFKDGTHFRASFVRCCVKDFDQLIVPEN